MPTYELKCNRCEHEWEDFFSITAPVPQTCPKCKKKGKVKRLISGGSGRGIVELSGNELIAKSKEDANKLKREAYSSEKSYSNIIGENNYQNIQSKMDKYKR
jgi:putative FmdB family regulatory protein